MASARYDVLGIGNAIVDVIARTEEDFLVKQGMNKGTMALIDAPRAEAIYDAMGPAIESSGGSAANTIVGVAGFGSRAAFIGKVKDDGLGRLLPTISAPRALPSPRLRPPTVRRLRAATSW